MVLILQFRIATMRCFGEDGGVAISLLDEDLAVCVFLLLCVEGSEAPKGRSEIQNIALASD